MSVQIPEEQKKAGDFAEEEARAWGVGLGVWVFGVWGWVWGLGFKGLGVFAILGVWV